MLIDPHDEGDYTAGDFLADVEDRDLLYFLLNVGNADCQLLVLPRAQERRDVLVVDVGASFDGKLPALLDALEAAGVLGVGWRIRLLAVTHPHADHVDGVPDLLDRLGDRVVEAWDAAYYHTGRWHELMYWLEDHPDVARLHPTSGTRRHFGPVAVTALSPSVRLRNAYDTYGVKLNNASISMLVEFPVARVFRADESELPQIGETDRRLRRERLLLGADAQTMSWSHVENDFPRIAEDHSPRHRLLGQAKGTEPLGAELFKVPHHLSKHGLNLELVERIRPYLSLASCKATTTSYAFPHAVALEQLREAIQSVATGRNQRSTDPHLGIHTTADECSPDADPDVPRTVLGSIGVRVRPGPRAIADRYQLWRFGDERDEHVDAARLGGALRYDGPNHARD